MEQRIEKLANDFFEGRECGSHDSAMSFARFVARDMLFNARKRILAMNKEIPPDASINETIQISEYNDGIFEAYRAIVEMERES